MSGCGLFLAAGLAFRGLPFWVSLLLGLGLLWAVVWLYQRESGPLEGAGSWLRRLRGALVLVLALLLSQPVLRHAYATHQKPVVVLMRDVSESMFIHEGAWQRSGRTIREATALGLIPSNLRNARPEDSARILGSGEAIAGEAIAALQQEAQQAQDGRMDRQGSRERLQVAQRLVGRLVELLVEARELVKDLPKAQGLRGELTRHLGAADRFESELAELLEQGPERSSRLLEMGGLLKAQMEEVRVLGGQLHQLQDQLDQELARGANRVVRDALSSVRGRTRAELVADLIRDRLDPEQSGRFELIHYDFDTVLRPPASIQGSRGARGGGGRRGSFPAETDLAAPLLQVAERHAQERLAAVVVFTDGRHTSGLPPREAALALAARGTPLHVVGVGLSEAPADLCVARLEGGELVFKDETIRLTAHLKCEGFKGKQVQLLLSLGQEVLERRQVSILQDGWRQEVFEVPARRSGTNVFGVRIDPQPGEALDSNNEAEAVVEVASDPLRVLLLDSHPRWESRYLASLLRRERKMELEEGWLGVEEQQGLPAKALPASQEALDEYDVLILGDVAPERLGEETQRRVARYVAERGGFVVFLAGRSAMPFAYLGGPMANLLPITWRRGEGTSPPLDLGAQGGGVALAEGSAGEEIVRIFRDPVLNEKLFAGLPELPWLARPAYPKPGAVVLLTTADARRDVLVAVQYYGAGRVLYVGSDQLWRWRFKSGDRIHSVFWSQAMRWGTGNRLKGGARLQVGCSRRQIRPDENLEILARPRDAEGRALGGGLVVAEWTDGSQKQRVPLQPQEGSAGLYRGTLQRLTAGVHRILVRVESPGFEEVAEQLEVVCREVAGQEGVELARDEARLAELAGAGHGRYVDFVDAPELFRSLPTEGRVKRTEWSYELWSSYFALGLVVVLLGVEWRLRKRMGLA